MLNLVLGIGLASLYYSWSSVGNSDDSIIAITTTPSILAAFGCVLFNLCLVVIGIAASKFHATRVFGLLLILVYMLGLVVVITVSISSQ